MPPRYAYWTILIGDEPTAFRSGSQEELMPTFKRLQQKHASARMMWWQNGKLWNSRLDAQEAMRMRGEKGKESDFRQPRRSAKREGRPSERAPRASERRAERDPSGKLDWKPKGESSSGSRLPAPGSRSKLEWKPKGVSTAGSRLPAPGSREKRKWIPKEEYKRSQASAFAKATADRPSPKSQVPKDKNWRPGPSTRDGHREDAKPDARSGLRRDKNWRPGGEHKDPRQKYKDAKKAKWGRFKQTIRKRWESKEGGKKKNE
jgi:hypothetical protein